jgi:tRNA (guanine37-N1)-methyltransferase
MDKVQSDYRELLRKGLKDEYDSSVRGYDVLGSIAVIGERGKRGRVIADAVMKINKNVKTVVSKAGAVKGRYRKREFEFVAGERNFIADYKENGCTFRFDIRKTFFSSRLSFERKRITELSKDNEHVVVMFAGIGPFAIEIAKRNRNSEIVAVELNRDSYKYMLENIRINKTANVEPILGDAKSIVEGMADWADRIVMPLPMSADKFLKSAIIAARNGCIIHYYSFGNSADPFSESGRMARELAKSMGFTARVVGKRVVRPYSKDTSEIVLDIRIGKKNKNKSWIKGKDTKLKRIKGRKRMARN